MTPWFQKTHLFHDDALFVVEYGSRALLMGLWGVGVAL